MRRGPVEREGGVVVLFLVLGLALMVGAGYVAAYIVAHDKVPYGTSVAGVEIGGQSRADAVRTLQSGLAEWQREPMTMTIGGIAATATPAEAGISVDYAATVARAGGARMFDPEGLWDYYAAGDDVDMVLRVDSARMRAMLEDLGRQTGTRARDGAISFATGRAVLTSARVGAEIDIEQASQVLVDAWADGASSVALPLRAVEPRIDTADLQAAVREFANPALSGPVTLVFADSRATLVPRDFAPLLSMRPQEGRLVPHVASAELAGLVGLVERDAEPVDASVALVGGAPEVVPARPGATYGPTGVAQAFLAAVHEDGGARTVRVKGAPVPTAFRTRDARRLAVTEQVGTFTMAAPTGAEQAAQNLSGTLLKPGDTLSLNASAGSAGAAAPHLATAAFNAAYLAGLEIVARTAPSKHLAGAPLGRDATAAPGGADLQVRNGSEHGVLVEARAGGGSVTVTLWSTRQWDVTTSAGTRQHVIAPATVVLDTPSCLPVRGTPGYDVVVTRTVRDADDGTVVRTETLHTSYQPTDKVACAVPPAVRD